MREPLADPPLVEAVCEFRFAAPRDLTEEMVAALRSQWATEYPQVEHLEEREIRFDLGPEGEGKPEIAADDRSDRWRFERADHSGVILLGAGTLAVSSLRPYQKWDVFRASIVEAFGAYKRAVPMTTTVNRLGLRYVNHLARRGRDAIRDVVTSMPTFGPPLKRPLRGFFQRFELSYDEGRLVHQTASIMVGEDLGVLLDLDFWSEVSIATDELTRIETWLDMAHDRVGDAFESSVNPEYYAERKKGPAS